MPTLADPDSDSAADHSDDPDSPTAAGDGEEEEEVEEVEEEEDPEEEENDDDDDDEEEEADGGEEEEEEGADPDSAVPLDGDDASGKILLEAHNKDLKLVSSTTGRSENTSMKDVSVGNLNDHDPSAKMSITHSQETSDIIARDLWSSVRGTHISSEQNGFPKHFIGDQDIKVQLEKETSIEGPKDGNSSFIGAHGDSTNAKNTGSLQVNEKEFATRNPAKSGSSIGNYDVEVPHIQTQISLQKPDDLSLSSIHTPKRRPRSSSPAAVGNVNKKPAIMCDFYARGWCIKGSSCRFLHQKEGTVDDSSGPSGKRDFLDDTGSRGETERLKLSASQEPPDSLNTESSPQTILQRALVRTYGGESHASPKLHDNKFAGEGFHKVDITQSSSNLTRGEYRGRFGISPPFDAMDERKSTSEDLLSGGYLNEEKLHLEMSKGEFVSDAPFSRTVNNLVPEFRYYSGGSSTTSGLYQTSNENHFAYDKRTEDHATRNQHSNFPLHGSYTSYSLTSSLSSNFSNSLQPSRTSPPGHTITQSGTSTRGPMPFNAEHLDVNKTLDFDRGYYGSRSASLPRNSSPYLSRGEEGNSERDFPTLVEQKIHIKEDSWEPSVPFRPSFYCAPASLSSPGSQYDPLLDSIDPPVAGNITFQASQRTIVSNLTNQAINVDPLLSGSHLQGHNVSKSYSSFPQPSVGKFGMSFAYGSNVHTAGMETHGPQTIDEGKSSIPKEDKHWIPNHAVESADVNDAEHGGSMKNPVEKNRNHKESKALRIFRAALVDFVKELVKPSWRGGHLSKDAHKTIVRKAVEKVLNALQPHQVPSNTESVNQYLSTSRPKLVKLVEGYVDKYAKAGASNA